MANSSSKKKNVSKRGFTLMELLVVISIIALLMAILVPALNKAKVQARTVVCKTRLHHWGTMMVMYSSDYRGYLGGQMNRLSEAVSVMEVGIENAMAVESGISDTDIAMEVATHTTSRIRAETAIAMQSQVNVIHQTAVQLLM